MVWSFSKISPSSEAVAVYAGTTVSGTAIEVLFVCTNSEVCSPELPEKLCCKYLELKERFQYLLIRMWFQLLELVVNFPKKKNVFGANHCILRVYPLTETPEGAVEKPLFFTKTRKSMACPVSTVVFVKIRLVILRSGLF